MGTAYLTGYKALSLWGGGRRQVRTKSRSHPELRVAGCPLLLLLGVELSLNPKPWLCRRSGTVLSTPTLKPRSTMTSRRTRPTARSAPSRITRWEWGLDHFGVWCLESRVYKRYCWVQYERFVQASFPDDTFDYFHGGHPKVDLIRNQPSCRLVLANFRIDSQNLSVNLRTSCRAG